MSYTADTAMRPNLPDPATAPELFEGILVRRVLAYLIDFGILLLILGFVGLVGLVAGVLTFGLALLLLPIVIPLVLLGYYAITLGSRQRATVGMAAMDIILTPTRGPPLDGWRVLIHPMVFWISFWIAWPISLLVALLTPRREMVHDLISGTLMVRRSPMEQHWRRTARAT